MRTPADTTNLSCLQEIQGITGGENLPPEDLLALRTFFLLLDAWDRNSKPVTPVDTQTESAQGERHASVNTRRQRAA